MKKTPCDICDLNENDLDKLNNIICQFSELKKKISSLEDKLNQKEKEIEDLKYYKNYNTYIQTIPHNYYKNYYTNSNSISITDQRYTYLPSSYQ